MWDKLMSYRILKFYKNYLNKLEEYSRKNFWKSMLHYFLWFPSLLPIVLMYEYDLIYVEKIYMLLIAPYTAGSGLLFYRAIYIQIFDYNGDAD